VDDSGKIVAIVPLHQIEYSSFRGFSKARRFQSTGGPAISPDVHGTARAGVVEGLVAAIDDLMNRQGVSSIHARIAALTPAGLASPGWTPSPLWSYGFEDCSEATWIVDLHRSEDDIRAGYSQLTRRELRKAEGRGGEIREARGSRDLEAYYSLHVETYTRSGIQPHPFEYFRIIFDELMPTGLARILLFMQDEKVIAAQNTGIWKSGAVYFTGASLTTKNGGENRALFHQQILRARADGCRFYETGQAFLSTDTDKEQGLSNFKASFGAVLARQCAGRRCGGGFLPRLHGAIGAFRSALNIPRSRPSQQAIA
jgi:hypothetical protein